MIPKAEQLKRMGEDPNWSNLVTDKKKDLVIDSRRSEESGLMSMRSTGRVEFSPLDVWRCINYIPWRKDWDVNLDTINFMSKEGAGAYTIYNRTKKIMVVAGRDFVLDFFTYQEQDGTIVIAISSNRDLYEKVP